MNPFDVGSAQFPTGQSSVSTPVMSAPGINPDAARLAEIERQAAERKVPGITAAPVDAALSQQDAVASAFDKAGDREKALEFEKLIQGGWPLYKQAWIAAGSPPEGNPDLLMTGDPKIDGGPNGTLVGGYKTITGYKDKNEIQAGRDAAAQAAVDGTASEAVAKLSGKDTDKTGTLIVTAADKGAALDLKEAQGAAERTSREKIAAGHDAARKAAASIAHALTLTNDAGKLAALGKLQSEQEDEQAKLDRLEADPKPFRSSWVRDHTASVSRMGQIDFKVADIIKGIRTPAALDSANKITKPPAAPSGSKFKIISVK